MILLTWILQINLKIKYEDCFYERSGLFLQRDRAFLYPKFRIIVDMQLTGTERQSRRKNNFFEDEVNVN